MATDPARALRLVEQARASALQTPPVARTPFVGRQAERDRLTAAYASAAGGNPAMVLIGGEAGIGKSRLLEQLTDLARERGALTAAGGCVPASGGLPYGPIVALLRDVVRQSDDAAAADLLERLAHDDAMGGQHAGKKGTVSLSTRTLDGLAKTRLFESVLSCLTQLAEQQPMVLGFEDLHWADTATAELIDFLLRNVTTQRVLLVGTYRVEDVGREHPLRPWLAELARNPRASQLRLAGLERADVAQLVAGIAGPTPDWSVTEAVWSRSQGNPFYAEELTAARHSAVLPAELRDLVLSRVGGLPAAAQKVVGFASVAGVAADHDLVAALSGLDPAALDAALVAAIEQQVLVTDAGTGYRFRHALLREAVYDSLLPGERRRLHREIAALLEADAAVTAEELDRRTGEVAAQWFLGGEWTRALLPSIAAADSAAAMLAYPEAHDHLEHALEALQRVPNSDVDQAELIEKTANAASRADAEHRARELAEQLVARIDATTDAETAARWLLLLARTADSPELARDCWRRCYELLPADAPTAALAKVLTAEAGELMVACLYRDAAARCGEALAAARAVGARDTEAQALNYLGCCVAGMGRLEQGLGLLRESQLIAEELADPDLLSLAYTNLSHNLLEGGRLEESTSLVFDMAAVGEQMWGAKLSGAAGNSVEALVRLGRYPEARALLAEITRGVQGMCAPAPFRLPCYIEIRTGRFDEAARLLAVIDEMTKTVNDVDQRGSYHELCAELALEEGRPEDAYAAAQEALRLAEGTEDENLLSTVLAFAMRAVADRLEGQHGSSSDVAQAGALATDLAAQMTALLARHSAETAPMPRTLAHAAMLAAEHSRLTRSAPELWAESALRWGSAREPHPFAYCLWRHAEALLEGRSGRGDAVGYLERAWGIARTLDAAPLLGRIERLATRARIDLVEAEPTADPTAQVAADLGLTPREVEVLGQLAVGRTDREIAESLFISKKTASVHVSNLLRKLSVTNRVEAGKVGQAHGLTAA